MPFCSLICLAISVLLSCAASLDPESILAVCFRVTICCTGVVKNLEVNRDLCMACEAKYEMLNLCQAMLCSDEVNDHTR